MRKIKINETEYREKRYELIKNIFPPVYIQKLKDNRDGFKDPSLEDLENVLERIVKMCDIVMEQSGYLVLKSDSVKEKQ